MSTELADYVGRTIDVMAFSGARASGEAEMTPQLFGGRSGSGFVCTGTQKLAQRFLLEFLTIQGSIQFKPLRGSRFLQAIRQGMIQSELDVFSLFAFSLGDIEANLTNEESAADPDDERYQNAELEKVIFSPTHLVLYVTVTSRAGASRKIILPVATML